MSLSNLNATMQKSLQISKAQQRHTLSTKARKKKPQSTLRNVLAQPFPRYWPQLSDEQSLELMQLLQSIRDSHPALFQGKERTEKQSTSTTERNSRHSISFGLSTAMRNLKRGSVTLLTISADLKPRYVVNQIILLALARNENINILCVPNLAERLKAIVNFPCIAFTVLAHESHEFEALHKWCSQLIAEHHPVPRVIRDYFSSHPHRREKTEKMDVTPLQPGLQNPAAHEEVNVEHLYLRSAAASDDRQRVFVPANAVYKKKATLKPKQNSANFLTLDTNDSNETISIPYQSLTIHQVQGNPLKVKRKKKKNKSSS